MKRENWPPLKFLKDQLRKFDLVNVTFAAAGFVSDSRGLLP
jgi:hypothetical protein